MIAPVYFIIFLVLVGFLYHLIRNKEYKDTLLESIIIGFIFGLLFNTTLILAQTAILDLFFIILVMIGGFLSVSIKKLVNLSNTEQNYTSTPQKPLKYYNWRNKHTPKFQTIIIIICLFSLILVIGTFSFLNTEDPVPIGNHVKLILNPQLSKEIILANIPHDKEGLVLSISNNTTQCTLKGSSEVNATIKITSSDLGIYNQMHILV